jgi:putative spermidine/putrescine transport system ATP-binding protein
MVFQNYALFPHMTVAENLAYPLSVAEMRQGRDPAKVQEYLDLVELGDFGARIPRSFRAGSGSAWRSRAR